jgi:hypothetical protein
MNLKENSKLHRTSKMLRDTQYPSAQSMTSTNTPTLNTSSFNMAAQFMHFILKLHKQNNLNYLYK